MHFDGREYKTHAHLGKEAAAGINTPYSHAFPRCKGCILFPVFGGEKAAAKIKPVNGLRVEIFRARCGKYYPSIDRLDSRNSGKSQTKANFKFPIDFNNV